VSSTVDGTGPNTADTPPNDGGQASGSSPLAASGPANSTIGPDGTVTTNYADGTKTITTPDGTVTTVSPDGSTNVASTLPPQGTGLSTGAGATDPSDPQQGQQAIGFTNQVHGPSSPSDPTSTISDMPNTAHVQGSPTPGSPAAATTPHKPTSP
jgi:hypothetical protein